MKRFNFQRGIVFVELNTRWELRRRLSTGHIQLESQHGEIINLTENEILKRWYATDWVIESPRLH